MPAPFAARTQQQREASQTRRISPGLAGGRTPGVAPVAARRVPDRTPPQGTGATLWVGPDEPTDGSVFWFDTDATC